jgi:crotonobetainyl-CoA:carnitine CoA-transferase CaiB-like acyl-CoA transferase
VGVAMPGALAGVRVIDFGQYIAGPLAAVMLADHGADVIHVDPPGGPRWSASGGADAFYNRGKRRISLDLKRGADLAIAKRLIDSADVVIENFRPGVMDRLGLGAAAMSGGNDRLIYCSMPGFAAGHPCANMAAWEGIIDAATENCKPRAGEPPADWDWSRPTYSAVPLASNFGGFLAATAIVMALIARYRSGRGQRVEAPLYDAMFTLIGHSGAYVNARDLHLPAGIHGRGAGAFRCADGRYVQFDTSSARHLTWFAREAGISHWGPDLLDIVRLRDPQVNERLHERLRELFLTRPAAQWEELGNRAGAAIGFVRTTDEWIATDHARQTGAVLQLDDPVLGPTWMAGLPVHLSEAPGSPQGPRRLPDADREQIVAELDHLPGRPRVRAMERDLAHPLQGMKVVDLCLALAGPTCGRLLGEFGADVVKINAPQSGGAGGYLSRGKRSLLLDVESVEGQQVFWKLVEQADIVLENFSPGTADRLGIGYQEARARRPEIIYTSISCYGYGGPWTCGRGWERQGQAVTGIMERAAAIPAVLGPYNLVDIGTGVMATFATALGVYHRLVMRTGQQVHASLAQTATYHQAPYMLAYDGHVADEPRGYEALGAGPLHRFYQARDGWFFLAATSADVSRLGAVEGLHIAGLEGVTLEQALEAQFAGLSAGTWVDRLRNVGVSAHAVTPLPAVMTDPWVRAHGLSVTQTVEGAGDVTMPGLSVRMSGTPMRLGGPPHQPGSDAEQILKELGLSDRLPALERAWALQTSNLPPAW